MKLSNIFVIACAISLAYLSLKVFSNIIGRIICFVIGVILLVIFLNNVMGIDIGGLSNITKFFYENVKIAFHNLKDMLRIIKS